MGRVIFLSPFFQLMLAFPKCCYFRCFCVECVFGHANAKSLEKNHNNRVGTRLMIFLSTGPILILDNQFPLHLAPVSQKKNHPDDTNVRSGVILYYSFERSFPVGKYAFQKYDN